MLNIFTAFNEIVYIDTCFLELNGDFACSCPFIASVQTTVFLSPQLLFLSLTVSVLECYLQFICNGQLLGF